MTRRKLLLAGAVLALAAAAPLVVFLALRSDRLDSFLALRTQTLTTLHENAASLPPGVEHRMLPPRPSNVTFPGAEHIRSAGDDWFRNGSASYELVLSENVAAKPASDLAIMLSDHFASGLEELGVHSSQSGGPGGIYGQRATHAQWWRDSQGQMIVALSVVVDKDSRAAHVHRFVHERFD